MTMRIVFVAMLVLTMDAGAALEPRYQNMKDLDVMIHFIKQHPVVLSRLKSIDFQAFTIRFGNHCEVTFTRESIPRPPGWSGPADSLRFKHASCPVD